jgi:hypothetical protein
VNWLVFIVANLDPALVARLGAVADDHLLGLSTDAAACVFCKAR